MSLSSGSVLGGRYRLSTLLGEGGVGEVWSATHLLTGRAVAIKRLLASRHGSAPSEARARFVVEARSACAVSHPNVVEVLDFVEPEDDAPFLVMELLRGETLAEHIARQGALSVEQTARLLLPVVSAVGTAHARGIVHRDLKPSNIFLSAAPDCSPVVKVLDFGIAKWIATHRDGPELRTQTGSTLGTPSYMSPEQATAERGVDHRADIWSLGVILYECLSGARPVDGENAAQMVMRLLSSGIIPIEHLVPELPPSLSAMVGRMLARDPAGRPQDLSQVFEVLENLAGVSAPGFAPADTPGARPVPVRSRRGVRLRGVRLRALALAGTACVAALLFARYRDRPELARIPPPFSAPSAPAAELESPLTEPAPAAPTEPAPAAPAEPAPAVAAPPTPSAAEARALARPAPPARSRSKERAERPASPTHKALSGSAAPRNPGFPRGADCERSSDCESRLCLAMTCE